MVHGESSYKPCSNLTEILFQKETGISSKNCNVICLKHNVTHTKCITLELTDQKT